MMQLIKKWRVILYFDLSEKSITFIIYDNSYSNMLRKLNEISFDIEPTKVEINEVKVASADVPDYTKLAQMQQNVNIYPEKVTK